ncbi:MAG: ABC transporter permease, partial [Gracilimonas sp.]|nr:ABC transporter permease [Gracilimonas sp.]
MRIIRVLLRKEFLQIFRNKAMLPILFVMPVVQLLVLSFAATYELKEVDFALVDMDQSNLSRELTAKFQATGYFTLELETFDQEEALGAMDAGIVKMIIQIPPDFNKNMASGQKADLQLIIDAVDGS